MPDQDFGLLSDTGRELYVADAINDLTRLRLQLASASLAGISERPEWGGIAASLRALGEDHPAIVVDAFAEVLKAVGEDAHAGEDHEFVALGVDTVDMLLRAGDEFDSGRIKSFINRIHSFAADRGLQCPEIPDAISAGQLAKPASRSPFATSLPGFELPPIDPPSWDLDEFAAPVEETDSSEQTLEVDQPTVDAETETETETEETAVAVEVELSAPPTLSLGAAIEAETAEPELTGLDGEVPDRLTAQAGAPVATAVGEAVGNTVGNTVGDSIATVVAPSPGSDAKKVVNFGPLFDPKLPLNLSPSPEPAAENAPRPEPAQAPNPSAADLSQPNPPMTAAPLGLRSQPDPVAELASAFDSIPTATAERAAQAAGSPNLTALAQGALWLAECVRPVHGVGGAVTASAVDGVRRDALAALAVDHVVSAAGSRQRIQVGEQTRMFLRRLQNDVGSFDEFSIDAQWCRIRLSEAAADLAKRLGVIDAVPLAVTADGGRQIWVPVQAQRLTIWQSLAEDGTACALPDLSTIPPADGVAWQALMIGPGGCPEVVAVAAGVPMPPAAPVVLLRSGPVVLDPGRWKRVRSTCFVLGAPLAGLDWVAGAALVAGESAVLLNPGMI